MAETRYWVCDGCGYKTDVQPETGTFVKFQLPDDMEHVPMMAVVFVDQTAGSTHREPEHVCLNCYEMGMVVAHG